MAETKISDMTPGAALDGTELLEMTQGGSTFSTTSGQLAYASVQYGAFCDATNQTGSTSTPTAVKFGTVLNNSHGITMVTDGTNLTRLTVSKSGTYQISVDLQIANSNAADKDLTVWMRKNGSDIAYSANKVTVAKVGDGGRGFIQTVSEETLTAGDYIQVLWLVSNVAVILDYTAPAAGPPAIPGIPSAHISAVRIA